MEKEPPKEPKTIKEKIARSAKTKRIAQAEAAFSGEPYREGADPELVEKYLPLGQPKTHPKGYYTKELGEAICTEVGQGLLPLNRICEKYGVDRVTFFGWCQKHEELQTLYTRARLHQADSMDDNIMEACHKVETAQLDPHQAKVLISAYQWRAERLKPKVYGAQSQVDRDTAASASAIGRMTTEELQALRLSVLAGPITIIDAEPVSDNNENTPKV